MYNLQMESLKRSLASLRRRYTIFMYTCKWNPSKGVWHPSEGGTLYLCITCKWNPSKGVWHPSEGGTLYLCILVNGIPQKEFGIHQKEVHCIYVYL